MIRFLKDAVDFAITPSNFLFLLAFAGLAALFVKARRISLTCTSLSVSGFLLFGYSSINEVLLAPLVTRFPTVTLEQAPEPFGIIVLGGGINELMAAHYDALLEFRDDGEAIPITALLARKFPKARIVLSAGNASGFPAEPYREADGMRRILMEFGVSSDRIAIDGNPHSTHSRIKNTLALVGPDDEQTWWVVTSAHRMPRVIGTYRQAGFDPIAFPVDFRWMPPFDPHYTYPLLRGLEQTDIAVHEWIGLAVYKWSGKTDSFFPAP